MTSAINEAVDAYVKEQAAFRVFSDLITICLETGNTAGALSRYQQAKGILTEQSLGDLREEALDDYGVTLA